MAQKVPTATTAIIGVGVEPVASWAAKHGKARDPLGCVDLSFEPKESTDEIEKTQEVPGQFVKRRT